MTGLQRGRLFDSEAAPASGERFEVLASIGPVVIEEIISSDQPDPVEYRQEQDEWVVVLSGSATLSVEGETIELAAGDWVLLPAGTPHQVVRTERGTQWLAVHVRPSG